MQVSGILLCGGSSTRFGGDKLLAGDPPIAARAARNLRAAVSRVIAVIPVGRDRLRGMLEREGCDVLETDRVARGMGASLAAGVEAAELAEAWIVALGDMPAIAAETLVAVRRCLERGALIAAPFDAAGRRGHPVGFAASLRPELIALDGDIGARDIVQRHAGSIERVVTADAGIFVDIDTPEDLSSAG